MLLIPQTSCLDPSCRVRPQYLLSAAPQRMLAPTLVCVCPCEFHTGPVGEVPSSGLRGLATGCWHLSVPVRAPPSLLEKDILLPWLLTTHQESPSWGVLRREPPYLPTLPTRKERSTCLETRDERADLPRGLIRPEESGCPPAWRGSGGARGVSQEGWHAGSLQWHLLWMQLCDTCSQIILLH